MAEHHERKDHETEQQIREALAMKSALGSDVARTFMRMRGIKPELAERVLTAPPGQLRP